MNSNVQEHLNIYRIVSRKHIKLLERICRQMAFLSNATSINQEYENRLALYNVEMELTQFYHSYLMELYGFVMGLCRQSQRHFFHEIPMLLQLTPDRNLNNIAGQPRVSVPGQVQVLTPHETQIPFQNGILIQERNLRRIPTEIPRQDPVGNIANVRNLHPAQTRGTNADEVQAQFGRLNLGERGENTQVPITGQTQIPVHTQTQDRNLDQAQAEECSLDIQIQVPVQTNNQPRNEMLDRVVLSMPIIPQDQARNPQQVHNLNQVQNARVLEPRQNYINVIQDLRVRLPAQIQLPILTQQQIRDLEQEQIQARNLAHVPLLNQLRSQIRIVDNIRLHMPGRSQTPAPAQPVVRRQPVVQRPPAVSSARIRPPVLRPSSIQSEPQIQARPVVRMETDQAQPPVQGQPQREVRPVVRMQPAGRAQSPVLRQSPVQRQPVMQMQTRSMLRQAQSQESSLRQTRSRTKMKSQVQSKVKQLIRRKPRKQ